MQKHIMSEEPKLSTHTTSSTNNDIPPAQYTTNEQDLKEAAEIQNRLLSKTSQQTTEDTNTSTNNNNNIVDNIPSVSLDEGAYKYVLITANTPSTNQSRTFVYSKRSASYHKDVAQYLLPILEGERYTNIRIKGGGRILRNDDDKKIHIFGYSYGFGAADHSHAKSIVDQCEMYKGYTVTWSNDGY